MHRALLAFGLVSLSLGAMACGGAAEGYDESAGSTVTVSADGMAAMEGKVVVFMASVHGDNAVLGSACTNVTAGMTKVSSTLKWFAGVGVCENGAEMAFEPGRYTVYAGVYAPGSTKAERCAKASVTVEGDTQVALPPFGPCE